MATPVAARDPGAATRRSRRDPAPSPSESRPIEVQVLQGQIAEVLCEMLLQAAVESEEPVR